MSLSLAIQQTKQELFFDEEQHIYRLGGRVVPSVTQVLEPLHDFSAVPPHILEHKRQIGWAVHACIDIVEKGQELDPDSIDEAVAGYFEGYLRFKSESGYVPILSEQRVYDSVLGYAGTLDGSGFLPKIGGQILLDRKTTALKHPSVGPQTAAYENAGRKCGLFDKPLPRFGLFLEPDGRYQLEPYTDRTDFAVFQSLLNIHHFRRKHKL